MKNKILVIGADEKIKGHLVNDMSGKCPFKDAIYTEALDGTSTFTFTVPYNFDIVRKHLVNGNHVAFYDLDGDLLLFNIIKVEDSKNNNGATKKIYCEGHYYELINHVVKASVFTGFTTTSNGKKYIDSLVRDSFRSALGHYEKPYKLPNGTTVVPDRSRWEVIMGESNIPLPESINPNDIQPEFLTSSFTASNALANIKTLLEKYDVEVKYVITTDNKRITSRNVKVYHRRGSYTGTRITFNKNLKDIKRTVDFTNVANRVYGRGTDIGTNKDGSVEYHDFADQVWSVANGDPVDKPRGQIYVEDKDSIAKYGVRETVYTENIKDIEYLLKHSYNKLKEVCEPKVTVTLNAIDIERLTGDQSHKFRLGDYVRIIDLDFDLSMDIRVEKISFRLNDATNTTLNLGNIQRNVTGLITRTIDSIKKESTNIINNIIPGEIKLVKDEYSNKYAELEQALKDSTDRITGAKGGYVAHIFNDDGLPSDILLMDQPDMNKARNLIRMNHMGIGGSSSGINGTFDVAIQNNGIINASAIKTGTLDAARIEANAITINHMANDVIGRFEVAEGQISSTIDSVNTVKDDLSSTRTEMSTLIEQTATGLRGEISSSSSAVKQEVVDWAENEIDNVVQITTTHTNQISSINATIDGINTKVSKNTTDIIEVDGKVNTTKSDLQSSITQTAKEIRAEVSSSVSTLDGKISKNSSSITQLSDKIETKVNSNDLSSLIQQNASSVNIAINSVAGSNGVKIDSSGLNVLNTNKKTMRLTEGKMHVYKSTDETHMGYFGTVGSDLRTQLYGASTYSVFCQDNGGRDVRMLYLNKDTNDRYGNMLMQVCGNIQMIHKTGNLDTGLNGIYLGNDDRADKYGFHNLSIRAHNSLGFQDNYGLTHIYFRTRTGEILAKKAFTVQATDRSVGYELDLEPSARYFSGYTREDIVNSVMNANTTIKINEDQTYSLRSINANDEIFTKEIDGATHIELASLTSALTVTVQEQQKKINSLEERLLQLESLLNVKQ